MLITQAIPAFSDNYIWALHNQRSAWVVDPGDSAVVINFLQNNQLKLEGILITHWHPDHTGGIQDLQAHSQQSLPVIGPDSEHIPNINHIVKENDTVSVLGVELSVLEIPGHTLDHIAFVDHVNKAVYCGDTLFAGGCGRIFEGTAEQMHRSLNKLTKLGDDYQVYCAHEYTLSNLNFALKSEPKNQQLQSRCIQVEQLRENNHITLPSTIGLEKQTNPFLRCDLPSVQDNVISHLHNNHSEQTTPKTEIEFFAALREWKNQC